MFSSSNDIKRFEVKASLKAYISETVLRQFLCKNRVSLYSACVLNYVVTYIKVFLF